MANQSAAFPSRPGGDWKTIKKKWRGRKFIDFFHAGWNMEWARGWLGSCGQAIHQANVNGNRIGFLINSLSRALLIISSLWESRPLWRCLLRQRIHHGKIILIIRGHINSVCYIYWSRGIVVINGERRAKKYTALVSHQKYPSSLQRELFLLHAHVTYDKWYSPIREAVGN
jgi:hypothetical protein